MSKDTIYREDAIEVLAINAPLMSDEAYLKSYDALKSLPSADRPKGEWKVINKTINATLVSCSECGKRFRIPNYCFKSERYRWKCCPICLADMRGDGNGTD